MLTIDAPGALTLLYEAYRSTLKQFWTIVPSLRQTPRLNSIFCTELTIDTLGKCKHLHLAYQRHLAFIQTLLQSLQWKTQGALRRSDQAFHCNLGLVYRSVQRLQLKPRERLIVVTGLPLTTWA